MGAMQSFPYRGSTRPASLEASPMEGFGIGDWRSVWGQEDAGTPAGVRAVFGGGSGGVRFARPPATGSLTLRVGGQPAGRTPDSGREGWVASVASPTVVRYTGSGIPIIPEIQSGRDGRIAAKRDISSRNSPAGNLAAVLAGRLPRRRAATRITLKPIPVTPEIQSGRDGRVAAKCDISSRNSPAGSLAPAPARRLPRRHIATKITLKPIPIIPEIQSGRDGTVAAKHDISSRNSPAGSVAPVPAGRLPGRHAVTKIALKPIPIIPETQSGREGAVAAKRDISSRNSPAGSLAPVPAGRLPRRHAVTKITLKSIPIIPEIQSGRDGRVAAKRDISSRNSRRTWAGRRSERLRRKAGRFAEQSIGTGTDAAPWGPLPRPSTRCVPQCRKAPTGPPTAQI
jgi:hypothetical protein